MKALERVRQAILGNGEPPRRVTSAELRTAETEVSRTVQGCESELQDLKRGRRDVLVTGTEQDLAKHDARMEELGRLIEQGEARIDELRRRRKKAEAEERLERIPERARSIVDVHAKYREAEKALYSARQELERAALALDRDFKTSTHRKLIGLEFDVDEFVWADVERIFDGRVKLPRPIEAEDPNAPVAVLDAKGPGDGWRFEGEWSDEDRRRLSQNQNRTPPRRPAPKVLGLGPRID